MSTINRTKISIGIVGRPSAITDLPVSARRGRRPLAERRPRDPVRVRLGNRPPPARGEVPHDGSYESGLGKVLSMCSLEDYAEVKHVMFNLD